MPDPASGCGASSARWVPPVLSAVLEAIRVRSDPQSILATWQEPLAAFRKEREKYLLY